MNFSSLIDPLLAGESLPEDLAGEAVSAIMEGVLSNEKIAALLTAFHCKGETVDEVVGAAKAMRAHALKVSTRRQGVLDTCGTGGDRSGTINISTTAAFVIAAAGTPVAKHGNRSASSKCGSIDLLEALGIPVMLDPEQIGRSLDTVGIGILFARVVHPAMKYAAPVRSELGFRTIFNYLGPLTNPVLPAFQLVGVSNPGVQEMYAQSLQRLGTQKAWVVSGGGLDEITITESSRVYEVTPERIDIFEITPESVGLPRGEKAELVGGDAAENAAITLAILQGKLSGPQTDAILLNAGAGLYISGRAASLQDGVELAREQIRSGAAMHTLQALRDFR
ncbi:MAG: anthranilate phosphoribosyltransferase [bacterium]|jgi:anthranilate phosphoribosyltransferase|nr:anthranilate phosphoribosyltransferase [bacterium]